jgi:hypothetical protein
MAPCAQSAGAQKLEFGNVLAVVDGQERDEVADCELDTLAIRGTSQATASPRATHRLVRTALVLALVALVCFGPACNEDSADDAGSGGSDESTGTGADPDYERVCQTDDFVCDDWGCVNPPNVVDGECYKPCTPGEIGGTDDECDEPERPYCSQIGLSQGGDYDCNGCVHVCVAVPTNQCNANAGSCE